jgi:hypothetical protein
MSWGNAAIVFGAWWYKDAILKFIMITLVVMIICYVIIIATNIPEKHWPPVFMGGILTVGFIYILPSLSLPSLSFGKKSDDEFVAPEVDYSNNPWRNGSIGDDAGWGGKRRRPKRSK